MPTITGPNQQHPACDTKETCDELFVFNILEAVNIMIKEMKVDSNGNYTIQKRYMPLIMLTFHATKRV